MLQNIIAYSVILIIFATAGVLGWLELYKWSIMVLVVAGWITNIGMAYHVRTMNEAKKDYENECDRRRD